MQLWNDGVLEPQFVHHVLGTEMRLCSDPSAVRGLQQCSPGNQGSFSCARAVIVTLAGTSLIKNATSQTLPSCTCSLDTATLRCSALAGLDRHRRLQLPQDVSPVPGTSYFCSYSYV